MRRGPAIVLWALLGIDVGLLAWSMSRLVGLIHPAGGPASGLADGEVMALMTVAFGATFVMAMMLVCINLLALHRALVGWPVWFVLAVLAGLIGLPDVVLIMLTGSALDLPRAVILTLLGPGVTFTVILVTAVWRLIRRRRSLLAANPLG